MNNKQKSDRIKKRKFLNIIKSEKSLLQQKNKLLCTNTEKSSSSNEKVNEAKILEIIVLIFGLVLKSYQIKKEKAEIIFTSFNSYFKYLDPTASGRCSARSLKRFLEKFGKIAKLSEIYNFVSKISKTKNWKEFKQPELEKYLKDDPLISASRSPNPKNTSNSINKAMPKSISRKRNRSKKEKKIKKMKKILFLSK